MPLELISSMHNDYFGWVRYTCSGILELSDTGCLGAIVGLGSNEFVVDKPFTVYSLLNLDAPHFRKPASCTDNCEVVGCFCRKQVPFMSFFRQTPLKSSHFSLILLSSYIEKIKNESYNLPHNWTFPTSRQTMKTTSMS